MECILSRTSVRSYTCDNVSDDDIMDILKAGFQAANGLNTQSLRFVIVQNNDMIERYSRLAKELYIHDCESTGNSHPVLDKIANDKSSNIFYGAPAVIFVFASEDAATPVEDGSLAIGNMMIAAKSMGYGTCWIGMAAGLGYYSTFREENDVPSDCNYIGCITLGRPASIEEHPRGDVPILKWTR